MNIFDNFELIYENFERVNMWEECGPIVNFETKELTDYSIERNPFQRKYRLQLRLHQEFWATDAELSHAKDIAKKAISEFLFKDILRGLTKIEQAISNSNKNAAYASITDLRKFIRDGD